MFLRNVVEPKKTHSPGALLIVAAFAIVYVVWGSTYVAILFAIETIPPFLMAGMRFLSAGLLLYAVVRPRQQAAPTVRNWLAATVVGCLMLVGGNGMVSWAEQWVPSGLAALIIGTVPLWMILFDWSLFRGPRPTPIVLVGLLIGLAGVYVLIGPSNLGGEPVNLAGGIALLFACVFWSFGSLYSRRARLPKSMFLSVAMQMIAAGVALVLLGTGTGEWARFDIATVTWKSWLSLIYLSLIGSIIAFSAYVWLLQVSSPARVSTYAYVNPVIAVILGALLAGEPVTARAVIAAVVIVAAVVIITAGSRRRAERPLRALRPAVPALRIPAPERFTSLHDSIASLSSERCSVCTH